MGLTGYGWMYAPCVFLAWEELSAQKSHYSEISNDVLKTIELSNFSGKKYGIIWEGGRGSSVLEKFPNNPIFFS